MHAILLLSLLSLAAARWVYIPEIPASDPRYDLDGVKICRGGHSGCRAICDASNMSERATCNIKCAHYCKYHHANPDVHNHDDIMLGSRYDEGQIFD